ncbi:hypothetical protein KIN20_021892 [Parelaphostrongylus tenuis]|uniref:Uncharacterized protein n=1 Tax=Parelaphostrongylus tenuis TaxID=148309 RepID=A0AAD5QWG6_PARTN|nr:hypothetical protein KIN20_021892 [Parelaphostrongylus tenuis]
MCTANGVVTKGCFTVSGTLIPLGEVKMVDGHELKCAKNADGRVLLQCKNSEGRNRNQGKSQLQMLQSDWPNLYWDFDCDEHKIIGGPPLAVVIPLFSYTSVCTLIAPPHNS